MTQSSLMTCVDLDESGSSTSPTCTSAAPRDAGCGLVPLTGTSLGRPRSRLTGGEDIRFLASTHPSRTCDQPKSYLIFCIHIHIWIWSMETPPCSSTEEEKLKTENDTLRRKIALLEEEILRLQAKSISMWGDA